MIKRLSDQEFNEAPAIIQFVYINAISNIPMGHKLISEAMEKHPEYFISKK